MALRHLGASQSKPIAMHRRRDSLSFHPIIMRNIPIEREPYPPRAFLLVLLVHDLSVLHFLHFYWLTRVSLHVIIEKKKNTTDDATPKGCFK